MKSNALGMCYSGWNKTLTKDLDIKMIMAKTTKTAEDEKVIVLNAGAWKYLNWHAKEMHSI